MKWVRRIALFPLTRLLLFLVLLTLLTRAFSLIFPGPLGGDIALSLGAVFAYLFIGWAIEGRSLTAIGLGPAHAVRDLAAGFGIAGLLQALVIGALALFGWYRVESARWDGALVAFALVHWLGVSLAEELLTRGTLFRAVEERLGSWLALLVSALFFGLAHGLNPGATLLSTVALTLEAGILLAAAYMLTRSLWLAIGIHWGWNFVQGTLFGAAVSGTNPESLLQPVISGPDWATGGPFGPEAGLFGIIIGTGAGLFFLWMAVHKGQVQPPFWRRRGGGAGE